MMQFLMYVIKMVAIQKFFCDSQACHPEEPGGDAPPSPQTLVMGLILKIQLFLFKSELDNSSFKDCASFVSIWLTDIM